MRAGVRLGVDVGTVRIGVARSDPHGMIATPVETVRRGPGDLARIAELCVEVEAVEVIVGLPIALSGNETASTADARRFALELAKVQGAPVRLVDERLSSVSANAALRSAGRTSRTSRTVVDQVAAVVILQNALDFERSAERPPGDVVTPDEGL
ncbi:Holliday junction resolvase RuvX [Leifsonia sp. H3M29-4]|uniref:Holliday junction resolvase RuvX n=1 Tax=Salinibacterium metalliresistens TaxID=3031321 RepID=UPI0023DCCF7F|nr:Holliday junction resolvase RuvX [Salinibacterium metalliresistens]MDF1479798.1 Holliday junction resolvase RuvX [Salinibacterium metalliresistens]